MFRLLLKLRHHNHVFKVIQQHRNILSNSNDPMKTSHFLSEAAKILIDYVEKQGCRNYKVVDFHHPHKLREILSLGVDEKPHDTEQILNDCKETLKYCVRTGHPRFFNQLTSGLDVVGLAGEWLTATANTNMFTYEIAPVFTLVEEVVIERMTMFAGWIGGDGIFTPGGAIANFCACLCARHKAFPVIKSKGTASLPQLVMFTSEQCHYSILRAAVMMGIGTDNVVKVKCNNRGEMSVEHLKQCIKDSLSKGHLPFFVNATCGTTVLGAFDPVTDIADVCENFGLWLHVDGAWGGGVLMSRKHRHVFDGLSRADSMTWNPHKLMGVPLQCSAILLREKGILESCNGMKARYLFQQDKNYDISYDTGDKTIQCGRHNDIFKLWLMWRSKGDRGFEEHVDKVISLAEYARAKLKHTDGFELVVDKAVVPNISFWYIPKRLRGMTRDDNWRKELHKVAPRMKALMMEAGSTLIGYQPIGDLPNFFRWIISNDAVTTADVDFIIEELDRLGKDL